MDLGVRELNNFLDFTFTGTTAGASTRFILYLDINNARTEYPLLNQLIIIFYLNLII
jgi:hypothetical protein